MQISQINANIKLLKDLNESKYFRDKWEHLRENDCL